MDVKNPKVYKNFRINAKKIARSPPLPTVEGFSCLEIQFYNVLKRDAAIVRTYEPHLKAVLSNVQ